MKVLFIDDEGLASVGAAVDELKSAVEDIESCVEDFDASDKALMKWRPDIVVLDLSKKGETQETANPGLDVRERIWKSRFCPIIYYTANTYLLEGLAPHPLVSTVTKGSGSEVNVVKSVQQMQPYAQMLDELNTEIERSTREALRDTSISVFKTTAEGERKDQLLRTVRRRVAARMDYPPFSNDQDVLRPWEHYLAPPPNESLLTGDVLRKTDGEATNPGSYALVLTPSCDLVADGTRKPKVSHVLVASCCPSERILEDLRVQVGTKPSKIKERLDPLLTQGYAATCIPLPELPGQFPTMVADLKNLQLLAIDEQDGHALHYERVASMDNPFREMVAWAYAASAGRPGLPDRDFEAWAQEIINTIPPTQKQQAMASEAPRSGPYPSEIEAPKNAVPIEETALSDQSVESREPVENRPSEAPEQNASATSDHETNTPNEDKSNAGD